MAAPPASLLVIACPLNSRPSAGSTGPYRRDSADGTFACTPPSIRATPSLKSITTTTRGGDSRTYLAGWPVRPMCSFRARTSRSSSAAPTAGSTIALRARVHAGSATGPVQVTFWNGNPATNGSIIATTQLGSIPSGGSALTAPVSWTVPKTQSQYSIFVQALPLDNFDTNMANNSASTTLTSPALFVSDTAANAVNAYAGGASGNVAPMATLSGAATGLDGPRGVLVDSFGDLFVANSLNNSVTEYGEGSKGNAAPKATISGAKTKLSQPQGLAMDASGNIYVSNKGNSSITEYRPGSNGNVTPIARISGAATKLSQPQGLALDGGRLYVANGASSSVTEYSQTAKGNAKPLATISGAATGLKSPVGLLFDSSGNLRVSNAAAGTITTYKPAATGNVKPISTISGKATGLNGPGGMDVDGAGQIAVANTGGKSVTFFAGSAKGNARPSATISGSSTKLSAPAFVAFTPPPAATTGNAITVKKNTATLTGIVDPTGSATVWYFAYKHTGSRTWSRSKSVFAGSGGTEVQVVQKLTRLSPGVTYRYRLVATNPGGNSIGATKSFTTNPK